MAKPFLLINIRVDSEKREAAKSAIINVLFSVVGYSATVTGRFFLFDHVINASFIQEDPWEELRQMGLLVQLPRPQSHS